MTSLTSPGFRSVGFRDMGSPASFGPVPGAIAYYRFDEGSGQILHDYSGNGNHGTLGAGAAAPTWTPQGLTFIGAQNVNVGVIAALASGNPFTIQAVAKFDDTTTTSGVILAQNSGTVATGKAGVFLIKPASTGRITFKLYDSDASQTLRAVEAPSVVVPGQYYAITATWDGVRMALYIGETLTAQLTTGYTPYGGHAARLGQNAYNAANYLVGGIAASGVYPFALPPSNVQQNVKYLRHIIEGRGGGTIPFEAGEPVPNPLPVAVLIQFDDGDATVYTEAYPILAAAGLTATAYVIRTGVGDPGKMTEAQIAELNAAGWDIGSHTSSHANLTEYPLAEQEARLTLATEYLDGLGLTRASRHVAYPFGGYNADTLTAMANTGMLTGRTTITAAQAVPITTPYELKGAYSLTPTVTVLQAKQAISSAGASRIVQFYGHRIDDSGESSTWSAADFAEFVAYVKRYGCRVVTISQLWDYVQRGYTW